MSWFVILEIASSMVMPLIISVIAEAYGRHSRSRRGLEFGIEYLFVFVQFEGEL